MEVRYPRCAGLDVHKETVVACVRIVEGGDVSRSVRTFATTTVSLIELGEWLEVNGCTHVAMEATGVYWKPVWQVLVDSGFELILANAAQCQERESVLSDVMGRSGRAMIQALIDGESDPAKLAALAHWKVRASAATLRAAFAMDASNVTIVFCLDSIAAGRRARCRQPRAPKPPTCMRNSCDCALDAGRRKRSAPVAASILTAAYHMLKDGTFYEDLGPVHFDRRRPETQARRLVKRLAELGFSVELKPAAASFMSSRFLYRRREFLTPQRH